MLHTCMIGLIKYTKVATNGSDRNNYVYKTSIEKTTCQCHTWHEDKAHLVKSVEDCELLVL